MDLILVHAVQLTPKIKVQISGRMASIGISEGYSEILVSFSFLKTLNLFLVFF